MNNIIELSLLALCLYLVGCIFGYAARRWWLLRAERPAMALKTNAEATPMPPAVAALPSETEPEEVDTAPVLVETSMPARPRRSNVRIVVPMPVAEAPPDAEKRLPFALVAPRGDEADNLKQINGIGPKLESKLNAAGLFHFSQIARLTKKEVLLLEASLGLGGRVERDQWVKQAKLLAKPAGKRKGSAPA